MSRALLRNSTGTIAVSAAQNATLVRRLAGLLSLLDLEGANRWDFGFYETSKNHTRSLRPVTAAEIDKHIAQQKGFDEWGPNRLKLAERQLLALAGAPKKQKKSAGRAKRKGAQ